MGRRHVVVLLALAAVLYMSAPAAAQYGGGFSVVSGQTLWTFADPSSLGMFLAKVVTPTGLTQRAVSAASGVVGSGGFVVAGTNELVSLSVDTWRSQTFSGYLFSDVAFFPPTLESVTVVAFGVERGFLANTPAFLRSSDGGVTWSAPFTVGTTEATGSGSISFANSLGVAAIGGGIYRSVDAGQTWTQVYNQFTTITKVSVYDSTHVVAFGPGTTARLNLISQDAGITWNNLDMPQFSGSITGFQFVDANVWLFTAGGQIWRTADAAKTWNQVLSYSNISWADVAFLDHWGGILLAAGSYPLQPNTGVLALSYDRGQTWSLSSPQPSASFSRVIPGVPSLPLPSPSSSPSSSPSAPPSPSSSPSVGASRSPSPSVSPSVEPSSSSSVSPSPSPSKQAPSTSPSASPSHHTAAPTPSASPSHHTAAPTPSASPSHHTAAPTPSASPAKKDSGSDNKLALGLGIGLGIGGALLGVALVGGAIWYFKNKRSPHVYHPINTTDV